MTNDTQPPHRLISCTGRFSSYLPEFVYGGIDGLVTTFAVVAGATGANLDLSVVLILGFANLFADGFSMSVGAYLSNKSEHDAFTKQIKFLEHEIQTNPKKRRNALQTIYEAQGLSDPIRTELIETITRQPSVWIDVLLKEQFGMHAPEKSPFCIGLSTFSAFVIIGLIPLLTYVFSYITDLDPASLFGVSIVLTGLGFLCIGWMKSYVNHTNKRKAMLETITLGGIAAAVAYYVGFVLEKILG